MPADRPLQAGALYGRLRALTDARVGLARAGQGLATAPLLEFEMAHARATDAVHAALDVDRLQGEIGEAAIVLESAARDRACYLRRPDLGRRLAGPFSPPVPDRSYDLAIIIADGLSATAVHAHAPAVVAALRAHLADWHLAPLVIARQARVAISDPIGEAFRSQASLILIGERPGLSASDSLGAYLTWQPRPGRRDSERNCVSNIRTPGGLSPAAAAAKLAWLLREARRLGLSGVSLKDRQGAPLLERDPGALSRTDTELSITRSPDEIGNG